VLISARAANDSQDGKRVQPVVGAAAPEESVRWRAKVQYDVRRISG